MDQVAAIMEAERIRLLDEVFDRLSLEFKSFSKAAQIIDDIKAHNPVVASQAAPVPASPATAAGPSGPSGPLTPVKGANKDGRPASAYPVYQRVVKKMFNCSTLKDVKATLTGAWVRKDYEQFDKDSRPVCRSELPGVVGEALEEAIMVRFVNAMVASHKAR